eukprot:scaffold586_cov155-Amphora_coffeaeformis.AAC.4
MTTRTRRLSGIHGEKNGLERIVSTAEEELSKRGSNNAETRWRCQMTTSRFSRIVRLLQRTERVPRIKELGWGRKNTGAVERKCYTPASASSSAGYLNSCHSLRKKTTRWGNSFLP